MPPLSASLSRQIRRTHVNQLAQMQISPPDDIARTSPPQILLRDTLDWIKANPGALKAAQDTRLSLHNTFQSTVASLDMA